MQQPASSFHNLQQITWDPGEVFDAIKAMIQNEVQQGNWNNASGPDIWCFVRTSAPTGVNGSWVAHHYQPAQSTSPKSAQPQSSFTEVLWPAGWPPPAPDINGNLPIHFFAGGGTNASGNPVAPVDITQHPAPTTQPGYKPCSECL